MRGEGSRRPTDRRVSWRASKLMAVQGVELMHKRGVVALFALASVLAVNPVSLSAETLAEALADSYTSNPRLRAQRAALRAIDEDVSRALAGYRPTTVARGSYGKRQLESTGTFSAGRSNLSPLTGQLEISQPLYRGGRTVAATRQAEEQVSAGRALLKAVEQDVLLSTVRAYINILRDQVVVQLNRNNESVLQRQLEATQDRFRVGGSHAHGRRPGRISVVARDLGAGAGGGRSGVDPRRLSEGRGASAGSSGPGAAVERPSGQ